MKKILFVMAILSLMTIVSCNTIKDNPEKPLAEDTRYYVKYVSDGLSRRYDVNYTGADGKNNYLANQAGETFERTIGPVSKGFKASFSIKGDYVEPTIRIEVKEGDYPFVVKAEATCISHTMGASVSYTIE